MQLNGAFANCPNLTEFTVGSTDTSSVTSIDAMFTNSVLTSLDLTALDTSAVQNMNGAFSNCASLTSMVGVEDFDITGLNSTSSLNNFLTAGKMTTAQYDNLLVNWEAQASGIPAMTASFGASIHSPEPSRGYTAKVLLLAIYSWAISDGVTP